MCGANLKFQHMWRNAASTREISELLMVEEWVIGTYLAARRETTEEPIVTAPTLAATIRGNLPEHVRVEEISARWGQGRGPGSR